MVACRLATQMPEAVRVKYETVRALVPTFWDGADYDLAVHIGMAGPQAVYSLERRAHRDGYALRDVDGDFLDDLSALIAGNRRVGVVGFSEFRNAGFNAVPGLHRFDLEYDVGAFDAPLPRIRVIPIDEFDPFDVLR